MAATRSKTTVRAAVDAELRALKRTSTVEGRQAQHLASLIDAAIDPVAMAPIHRELRAVMDQIRILAREKDTSNPLATIRKARADRRREVVVQLEDERDRRRGTDSG